MNRGSAQRIPVFRFAPSPNRALHLGHALSALTGFEWARRYGGRFLLRIEDIDLARVRPGHVQAIFSDLDWLGVRWEEPVFRQSEPMADDREAITGCCLGPTAASSQRAVPMQVWRACGPKAQHGAI